MTNSSTLAFCERDAVVPWLFFVYALAPTRLVSRPNLATLFRRKWLRRSLHSFDCIVFTRSISWSHSFHGDSLRLDTRRSAPFRSAWFQLKLFYHRHRRANQHRFGGNLTPSRYVTREIFFRYRIRRARARLAKEKVHSKFAAENVHRRISSWNRGWGANRFECCRSECCDGDKFNQVHFTFQRRWCVKRPSSKNSVLIAIKHIANSWFGSVPYQYVSAPRSSPVKELGSMWYWGLQPHTLRSRPCR